VMNMEDQPNMTSERITLWEDGTNRLDMAWEGNSGEDCLFRVWISLRGGALTGERRFRVAHWQLCRSIRELETLMEAFAGSAALLCTAFGSRLEFAFAGGKLTVSGQLCFGPDEDGLTFSFGADQTILLPLLALLRGASEAWYGEYISPAWWRQDSAKLVIRTEKAGTARAILAALAAGMAEMIRRGAISAQEAANLLYYPLSAHPEDFSPALGRAMGLGDELDMSNGPLPREFRDGWLEEILQLAGEEIRAVTPVGRPEIRYFFRDLVPEEKKEEESWHTRTKSMEKHIGN